MAASFLLRFLNNLSPPHDPNFRFEINGKLMFVAPQISTPLSGLPLPGKPPKH